MTEIGANNPINNQLASAKQAQALEAKSSTKVEVKDANDPAMEVYHQQANKAKLNANRITRKEIEELIAAAKVDLDKNMVHRIDLSGKNLSGMDLSFLDLQYANLHKANLRGASLSGTKLFRANLWRADLTGAIVNTTEFEEADMRRSKWQKAVPIVNINFDNANLRGEDLRFLNNDDGKNWRRYKFASADLTAANLEGLKVPPGALNGAYDSNTELYRANLKNVEFLPPAKGRRPIISLINFSGANCEGIKFNAARFEGSAYFDFTNLNGADFSFIDISLGEHDAIIIRGADLRGAKFDGAHADWIICNRELVDPDLHLYRFGDVEEELNFCYLKLRGLDLSNRDLSRLNYSADCTAANLENVDFTHTRMLHSNLNFANLKNTNFTFSEVYDNISTLKLYGAFVERGTIEKQVLAKKANDQDFDYDNYSVGLEGKSFIGFDFSNRDLSDLDWAEADLRGANLSGANLTGINLKNADLMGANLTGANLTDADLTDADLTDVNFTGATLNGADFLHAHWGGKKSCFEGTKAQGAKYMPRSIAQQLDFGNRSYHR